MEQRMDLAWTVLIVGDEGESREVLGRLLRADGYRVVAAACGPDAVAVAVEAHPDATVLDLSAAEAEGIATLRELRRRGEGGAVVVLTGHGTLRSARSALSLGVHHYLTNPCSEDLLRSALRQGVEDRFCR